MHENLVTQVSFTRKESPQHKRAQQTHLQEISPTFVDLSEDDFKRGRELDAQGLLTPPTVNGSNPMITSGLFEGDIENFTPELVKSLTE